MSTSQRLPLFDTLRGSAMLLMAVFHFCYDLKQFKVISYDFNTDLFWILFRGIIITSFMFLVGVSLYLSRARYDHRSYWIRLFRIAFCALIISVATAVLYGKSWIFFGVLHFVVFATLLGPLLIRIPKLALPIGLFLIAIPRFFTHELFNESGWNVVGLSPWAVRTKDYAPILPWLGVVMVGIFIGWAAKKWPTRATTLEIPWLSRLGHHALMFYMTHQVVLYPLAWLISRLKA